MNQMVRLGAPLTRTEDHRFLTGAGCFIDDLKFAGMCTAAIVRAPVAHARITRLDVDAARASPGVLLVVTGAEWAAFGYGPVPTKSPVTNFKDGRPMNAGLHHCLTADVVRCAGEAIALIVAETQAQAIAAAECVEADYEDLPAVVDQVTARTTGHAPIWSQAPENLCVDFELGNREAVEAAFVAADHTVSLDIRNNRVTSAPMEPRGCLGLYDASRETFTLWNSSQNLHPNRDAIAEKILGVPKDAIRHVAPDVGGGFGAKNPVYAETALVLHAARALGRPVKWVADRSEAFLTDVHGRDQISTVSLAMDRDGTFRALNVHSVGNVGAWCGTVGPFVSTGGSARTQGGPYAFDALLYTAEAAFTNTAQTDPYRGAGRPEASFHIERIIDYAAAELGFDPIALRRKNLIPRTSLPWTTPMGLNVDSGDFAELLDQTLALADFEGFEARRAEAEARGLKRGFAIAPYLECTGGLPKEEARISVAPDGHITLAVGSHSTGMSHETVHCQLLAAEAGVAMDAITFRQADTDATDIGGGHGGSRGMEVGGNAVRQAAETLRRRLGIIAAHALNSTPDDIEISDGLASDARTGQSLSVAEIATIANDPARCPPDMGPKPLDIVEVYERTKITVPNGVHAAEVEVDPEMGVISVVGFWAVDDFGRILNPLLADGQVMGGIAQGLGQALFEEIVYDPDSGQLLTGSFMDYCLPRADDLPLLHIAYYEEAPTTHNPLGVKGAGEAGCCGAPPAIVNAVMHALAAYGVRHIDMPLTPEKVWRAIHDRVGQ
ncbi:MAG: xanthine dehydrogenase family protein molybdopterin-binding subunit [Pseudomonadota bacterium]